MKIADLIFLQFIHVRLTTIQTVDLVEIFIDPVAFFFRDRKVYTPDRVYADNKGQEVYTGVVIDPDAEIRLDRVDQKRRAAERIGGIDTVTATARDSYIHITHDTGHVDLLLFFVNGQDYDSICASVQVRAGIDTQKQDIDDAFFFDLRSLRRLLRLGRFASEGLLWCLRRLAPQDDVDLALQLSYIL